MNATNDAYRLWLDETVPGDGEETGRYLGSAATLDEADALGQGMADYHRAMVIAYPPQDRMLIGDRVYQPSPLPPATKGGAS